MAVRGRLPEAERLAVESGREKWMAEGKAERKAEGKTETLSRLLTRRFGPVPEWVRPRQQSASTDQLDLWADRVLDAPTLPGMFDLPLTTTAPQPRARRPTRARRGQRKRRQGLPTSQP